MDPDPDEMVYQPPASDVPVPSAWQPQPMPAPRGWPFDAPAGLPPEGSPDWTGPQLAAWALSCAVVCALLGGMLP